MPGGPTLDHFQIMNSKNPSLIPDVNSTYMDTSIVGVGTKTSWVKVVGRAAIHDACRSGCGPCVKALLARDASGRMGLNLTMFPSWWDPVFHPWMMDYLLKSTKRNRHSYRSIWGCNQFTSQLCTIAVNAWKLWWVARIPRVPLVRPSRKWSKQQCPWDIQHRTWPTWSQTQRDMCSLAGKICTSLCRRDVATDGQMLIFSCKPSHSLRTKNRQSLRSVLPDGETQLSHFQRRPGMAFGFVQKWDFSRIPVTC